MFSASYKVCQMEKKFSSNQKELPTGIWKLERYGTHEDGKWTEILAENHNIFLIFQNLCLTLQHGQILIEHIPLLTENVRVLRKHDSLGILVVKENIKTKKLRMKFAGTNFSPGIIMIQQCANMLKPFVRIEDISLKHRQVSESQLSALASQKKCECKHVKQDLWSVKPTPQTQPSEHTYKVYNDQSSKPTSLFERVSEILNKNITDFHADNHDLSSLYPLDDIVESCILDPDFPSFVAQVHRVLKNKLKNNRTT